MSSSRRMSRQRGDPPPQSALQNLPLFVVESIMDGEEPPPGPGLPLFADSGDEDEGAAASDGSESDSSAARADADTPAPARRAAGATSRKRARAASPASPPVRDSQPRRALSAAESGVADARSRPARPSAAAAGEAASAAALVSAAASADVGAASNCAAAGLSARSRARARASPVSPAAGPAALRRSSRGASASGCDLGPARGAARGQGTGGLGSDAEAGGSGEDRLSKQQDEESSAAKARTRSEADCLRDELRAVSLAERSRAAAAQHEAAKQAAKERAEAMQKAQDERFAFLIARAEGLSNEQLKAWSASELVELAHARYAKRNRDSGGPNSGVLADPVAMSFLASMEGTPRFQQDQSFSCPFCKAVRTTRAGMEYHIQKRVCRKGDVIVSRTENRGRPSKGAKIASSASASAGHGAGQSEDDRPADDVGAKSEVAPIPSLPSSAVAPLTSPEAKSPAPVTAYECPTCSAVYKSLPGIRHHLYEQRSCRPHEPSFSSKGKAKGSQKGPRPSGPGKGRSESESGHSDGNKSSDGNQNDLGWVGDEGSKESASELVSPSRPKRDAAAAATKRILRLRDAPKSHVKATPRGNGFSESDNSSKSRDEIDDEDEGGNDDSGDLSTSSGGIGGAAASHGNSWGAKHRSSQSLTGRDDLDGTARPRAPPERLVSFDDRAFSSQAEGDQAACARRLEKQRKRIASGLSDLLPDAAHFRPALLVGLDVAESKLYAAAAGLDLGDLVVGPTLHTPVVASFGGDQSESRVQGGGEMGLKRMYEKELKRQGLSPASRDSSVRFSLSPGPIWALDASIARVGSSGVEALVAVSHHSPARPATRPLGTISSGRNVLLVLKISIPASADSDLSDKEAVGSVGASAAQPGAVQFCYGIAHDCDTVLDLEFCPHVPPSVGPPPGAFDTCSSAGLLAAAMGDGVVRVYALPHPEAFSSSSPGDVPRLTPVLPSLGLIHLIPVAVCASQGHPPTCVRWSRQVPGQLVVGSSAGAVLLFNVFEAIRGAGQAQRLYAAECGFRFSPSLAAAAHVSGSKLVRVFPEETFVAVESLFLPPGSSAVRGVALAPSGAARSLLASCHSDGCVRLWDLADAQAPIADICVAQRQLTAIDFTAAGAALLVAVDTGEIVSVSLLDWSHDSVLQPCHVTSLGGGSGAAHAAVPGSDRRFAAAWDVRTLQLPASARCPGNGLAAFALATGLVGVLPMLRTEERKDLCSAKPTASDMSQHLRLRDAGSKASTSADGGGDVDPASAAGRRLVVSAAVGERTDSRNFALCVSPALPPTGGHVALLFSAEPTQPPHNTAASGAVLPVVEPAQKAGPKSGSSKAAPAISDAAIFLPQFAMHRVRLCHAEGRVAAGGSVRHFALVACGGGEGAVQIRLVDVCAEFPVWQRFRGRARAAVIDSCLRRDSASHVAKASKKTDDNDERQQEELLKQLLG